MGRGTGRGGIGEDAAERAAREGAEAVGASGDALNAWTSRQWAGLVGVAIAGMLLGATVVFFVVGWSGVADVGGSCGGDGATPCPDGATETILLGFVACFAGVIIAIAGFAGLRQGAFGTVMLVLAGLLGAFGPAQWTADALRGEYVSTAWRSPAERTETPGALGVWPLGDGAVRVRADGAVGYDAVGKRVTWTYTLPGSEAVCGMSRTSDAAVGVLAHAAAGGACAGVTALDLATGKALWTYRMPPADPGALDTGTGPDRVAVTGGVVAVVQSGKVQALDARTGAPRWHALASPHAPSVEVVAGSGRFVVVTHTPGTAADPARPELASGVRSIDAANGGTIWSAPLPRDPSAVASVDVLAAAPVTLWVQGPEPRPVPEITSYDDTGRPRATIPAIGPDETLTRETSAVFEAQPRRHVVVIGDTLLAAAKRGGAAEPRWISAYSLADGRRLWSTEVGKWIMSVGALPDGALVSTGGDSSRPEFRILDPSTGRAVAHDRAKAAKPGAYRSDGYEVFRLSDGGWVLVHRASAAEERGVTVLR